MVYVIQTPDYLIPSGENVTRPAPTFDNYKIYKMVGEPNTDGVAPLFEFEGIVAGNMSIFLWRNYNIFDDVPALIRDDWKIDDECEDCKDTYCDRHKEWLVAVRFGDMIYAADYERKPIRHIAGAEIALIHDNGGRPFRVFYNEASGKIVVYRRNPQVLLKSRDERKDYLRTSTVILARPIQVRHVRCECLYKKEQQEQGIAETQTNAPSPPYEPWRDMSLYDDLVFETAAMKKLFIDPGHIDNFDNATSILHVDLDPAFCKGNGILVYLGDLEYCIIYSDGVKKFTAAEEIAEFYSVIGRTDVPYVVAYSANFAYLFTEGVILPRANLAGLSDEDRKVVYSFYYGHACVTCRKHSEHTGDAFDHEFRKLPRDGLAEIKYSAILSERV